LFEILNTNAMKSIKLFLLTLVLLPFIGFGQGWQIMPTPTAYILYDISFPGNQNLVGYAVGSSSTYNGNGVILKTTNGGDSWTQLNASTIPGLEACYFFDENTGFIGGWQNYFAKTTDGGLTWTPSTIAPTIWYVQEIDFYDNLHGMVCCAGAENYRTSDGGLTWTQMTGLSVGVEDLDYVSSSLIYAVGGDEKIAKSTDGGANWSIIYTGNFQSPFLGVDFLNPNYGVVGGEDGKVMITNDGGSTWFDTIAGPYFHLFHGVHVFNTDSTYIAGTPEGIFKTNDGGTNWVSNYAGGNNYAMYKIAVTPDNTMFICGSQGKIFRKKSTFQAAFTVSQQNACIVAQLFYTAQSPQASSWEWSFPGGSPSSSNVQNPGPIVYSSPGDYDVQLIASNGISSDTLLMPNYVHILLPATPAITGSSIVGEYNSYVYAVTNTPGNTYAWTVSGGTITSGANSSVITVQWGAAGQGTVDVTETNPGCSSYTSLPVTITINIGINESGDKKPGIYPDPTSGLLNISGMSSLRRIQICDITGNLVKDIDCQSNNNAKVDISHLKAGTYLVIFEQTNGVKSGKTIRKIDE
jgi:photosystem II stability/assembly factor-like uncharacterized protein